ncbi:MAG: flagellar motor protein MotD, partial [Bryobacteraceae bacterium]
ASNSTAKGRAQNRRVELIVSGKVIGVKIGVPPNTAQQNPAQQNPSANPANGAPSPQPPMNAPQQPQPSNQPNGPSH